MTPVEGLKLLCAFPDGLTGELFLVHGHQGTRDSDRNRVLSEFAVRHGWTWLQKRLDKPWNTPSVDWRLRGSHNETMYAWACDRGCVLVAGHTHQPVFYEHEKKAEEATPVRADSERGQALRLARSEWDEAERERLTHQRPADFEKPCYFNTGCCSFGDGDITGIEISGGEIRLIRWACAPDTKPLELAHAPLEEVMATAAGG